MLLDAETLSTLTSDHSSRTPSFMEAFAERRTTSAMVFRDGAITDATTGQEQGVGIRARHGNSTVHSVVQQVNGQAVRKAIASAAATSGQLEIATTTDERTVPVPWTAPLDPAAELSPEPDTAARRAELLSIVDDAVTEADSVTSVTAVLRTEHRVRDIANSLGDRATGTSRRERVAVTVAVGAFAKQAQGRASVAINGTKLRLSEADLRDAVREAARRAHSRLQAIAAPLGEMPVVLAPGSGAVLIHEALGHGLEADHLDRRSSIYHDLLGQQIGPSGLHIVDDGNLPGGWGTESFDDEGRPTNRTALVEDGVLVGYMFDLIHTRENSAPDTPSANGRRQNYQCLPLPRMTNTLVLPGTVTGQDIVEDTKSGIYVARLGDARVNTATGDFVFTAEESYVIRQGRMCEPLAAHTLVGNGPAVLREIDGIGSDFALGPPGNCGKDGQTVPVGYGQPTLRVPRGLTVGGSKS
ncbi:TldD/PmbA family protein [Streptomyces luteogriseus]|uniref:TldD/PmbA family protein n=1 Tax=Streptomyces luteogriseus TaxID=68233 RepID=UPI0034014174